MSLHKLQTQKGHFHNRYSIMLPRLRIKKNFSCCSVIDEDGTQQRNREDQREEHPYTSDSHAKMAYVGMHNK